MKRSNTHNLVFVFVSVYVATNAIMQYRLNEYNNFRSPSHNNTFQGLAKPLNSPCITWITFGNAKYNKTVLRIIKEAESFPYITHVHPFNEEALTNIGFFHQFSSFVKEHKRGFGYWIWKPFIINYTLHNLVPEHCFLLYMDSGCTLNAMGANKTLQYMRDMKERKKHILAYQMQYTERSWTKGDLFDFFETRNDASVTDTGQFAATLMFLLNSQRSRNMANEWLSVAKTNKKLLTDEVSVSPNLPEFYENRHDQSIFSLLVKTAYKDDTLVVSYEKEAWASPEWDSVDWSTHWPISPSKMLEYPFLATRFRFL